ncbi:MAG: HlyD family efflux transporter periplasmic adaptor subunit [Planctomycetaceae bacterium]
MRRCVVAYVCGVTGVVLAASIWALEPLGAQQPTTPSKQTSPPEKSTQIIPVPDCRIKLKDQRELASERVGIIASVEVEQGQAVEKDALIVQLKDDVARSSYQTAQERASTDIEIRFAKKAKQVADKDYDRAVQANRRLASTVPEAEVEKLQLTAEKSQLQIEQADHQYKVTKLEVSEAEAQLDSFKVIAPITGYVSRVHKRSGEAVAQGEVIVEIVNTDRMLAEGYINVVDADRIQRGCYVEVASRGQRFPGYILNVDRMATLVGAQVKVYAEIENRPLSTPDGTKITRLLAGLIGQMDIHPGRLVKFQNQKTGRSSSVAPLRPNSGSRPTSSTAGLEGRN